MFGAPAERATTNRRPNPKSSVFSLGRNCSTAKWQKLNFIIPVPKKLLFYEQELRPLTKVSRRSFFCKITHKSSAKSIEIWYNKSIEKPHKKRDFNA